jgi:hypothetical protein
MMLIFFNSLISLKVELWWKLQEAQQEAREEVIEEVTDTMIVTMIDVEEAEDATIGE